MPDDVPTVQIENAQIIFRNFEGKEGPYNRAGERNFAVILPEDLAKDLAKDGWNVKRLKGEEGEKDGGDPYIQVSVGFKNRPPRITMITTNARTHLTEDQVEVLDGMEFKNVDLIFRAYNWEVNGKTGVKAYLQTMFVTILEDALELKYAAMAETPEGYSDDG